MAFNPWLIIKILPNTRGLDYEGFISLANYSMGEAETILAIKLSFKIKNGNVKPNKNKYK